MPFYKIDAAENRISVSGPLRAEDWDAIADAMKERGIARLDAGGIGNADMERISKLEHITHLRIANANRLDDEGALLVAKLPRLVELELGGHASPITDRALDALRSLPALERFQICWTPGISDAGLANLSYCEPLESVNLMGTSSGDGAIQALAGKPRLRRLWTGNGVTDAGLRLLHQFPQFKFWSGGEVEIDLMTTEVQPNQLQIDGPFTDAGLAALDGLDGLCALNLFWHSHAFTSAGLGHLRSLPRLAVLGCGGEYCDDEAMGHIAALPHLRKLLAQDTVASDAGFAALSQSKTIEYIWGRRCANLTGTGFAALSAMPSLRGLAVSCRNVDDASLSALPHFPALREFMPMDVPDAGFVHAGRCEKLGALWCMYCRDTGDAATENIAGLWQLKSYYAGMTQITDRSLDVLAGMPSLERLEFWQCAALTDGGLARLAALPRLRKLVVDGCPRDTRG